MATNTYDVLDTKTVSGTSTGTISLTAIPQNYTDLRIVFNGGSNIDSNLIMRYNGDSTSTLYSYTFITGDGATATSGRAANANQIFTNYFGYMSNAYSTTITIDILNYSNTSLFKTNFSRSNNTANGTAQLNGLWRSNSAITSIDLIASGNNFLNGTTVSLYGIRAEGVTPAPKAIGGAIYSDSTYYYHVFGSTGVFTPTQSITADVLVVAGGGGSGCYYAGGGGAGGFRVLTSQSLTTTNYTATIGAGGAGINEGSTNKGTNSSFASITATGGGAANQWAYNSGIGYAGGSGGGASLNFAVGGAGNQGGYTPSEGNNGGSGGKTGGNESTGGGGGAGGSGGNAGNGTTGGAGGIGNTATFNAWGLATGTGQNVNGVYYIAGGGGGGTNNTSSTPGAGGFGGGGTGGIGNGSGGGTVGSNGLANTGGGAGGSAREAGIIGGSGGSGIVIVRYLKA